MKKILYTFILFFLFTLNVNANENIVNIYLFHSSSCKHCNREIDLLNELEKEYSNIRIYKYEVEEDKSLFNGVTNLLGVNITGVPFTIIGDKYFVGYNESSSKRVFMGAISYYSKYGYDDIVGKYIGDIKVYDYKVLDSGIDIDSYIDNYGNYKIIGNINSNDIELTTSSILLGIINGFNIYNLIILLVLIFLIIIVKDIKRLLIYGFSLIVSYCLLYFIFFDISILKEINLVFNNILSISNLSYILEKSYMLLYILGIFIDFVIMFLLLISIKKALYRNLSI